MALKTSGHTSEETVLVKAFKYFDLDNSGQCSISEFLKAITKIGITGFSDSDLEQIFNLYDTDGSGELDYKEFVGGIFSNNSVNNESRNPKKVQAETTSPVKRMSKQEYLETEEVDNILQKIRSKLASRGVRGICSIARNFRIIDDNNSQSLDMTNSEKQRRISGLVSLSRKSKRLFSPLIEITQVSLTTMSFSARSDDHIKRIFGVLQ